ncbi:hypothetical protein BATDEDRAFT_35990 [Batrachochytrium dendrobatidis JAM81]|uniref:Tubulin polyglutamylase TTLL4 n=1 Tax=Batrachochytrium dendrobatidis (strain JAM81 / FGSC 10211) TaxID=684364 RepID=F4PB96_BATDJ|nr:uncharacterized protein BATDEDRAFT_35990 [Batrachochytrium dendrobatidis JAM81]EGF77287.1 hypothetical protein BATDEDRAFT_35990 [Batrachochytrium dendrobatidis JAM81]KAK5669368.1 Tubulin polyglutamylase ttll4 [Batrachochytrium dendrobatidis]|eukprot:XP_006681978.1 hypothetical protein BATDEDRAFT_35990 [Batrachochytrium dendrobatidis JAM81]
MLVNKSEIEGSTNSSVEYQESTDSLSDTDEPDDYDNLSDTNIESYECDDEDDDASVDLENSQEHRQDMQNDKFTSDNHSNDDSRHTSFVSGITTCIHTPLNGENCTSVEHLSQPSQVQKFKSPICSSLFLDGEAVLYFPQPGQKVGLLSKHLQSLLVWKVSKGSPRVIRNALRSVQFKLIKTGKNWIGYWGKHLPSEKYKDVEPWQKINHFPMSFEIGRKDRMYMNNMEMRERFGHSGLDFTPETFILPRSRRILKRGFSKYPLWILKPPASARGNGIRVINKWSEIPKKRDLICSQYISNPFLVYQRKFDLRLYVVVTSFDPLRIYLYKDGIVRFASEPYQHNFTTKNIRNRFVHLTNYSINKVRSTENSTAVFNSSPEAESSNQHKDKKFDLSDNKWTLSTLQEYMTLHGYNFPPVMDKIRSLLIKTIMSAHTQNTGGVRLYVNNRRSCYEMFGFDVLFDTDLKPWLMEVNISPSMKASCDLDFELKSKVAVDLFNLVGIRIKDLEMAKAAQSSKTAFKWKRPFLTTLERNKQRSVMANECLDILQKLTSDDLKILKETEDENARKGGFERLYPSTKYLGHSKFFSSFNYYDRLLYHWTNAESDDLKRISKLKNASMLPISLWSARSLNTSKLKPNQRHEVLVQKTESSSICKTVRNQKHDVHQRKSSTVKTRGDIIEQRLEKVRLGLERAQNDLDQQNNSVDQKRLLSCSSMTCDYFCNKPQFDTESRNSYAAGTATLLSSSAGIASSRLSTGSTSYVHSPVLLTTSEKFSVHHRSLPAHKNLPSQSRRAAGSSLGAPQHQQRKRLLTILQLSDSPVETNTLSFKNTQSMPELLNNLQHIIASNRNQSIRNQLSHCSISVEMDTLKNMWKPGMYQPVTNFQPKLDTALLVKKPPRIQRSISSKLNPNNPLNKNLSY